MAAEGEKVRVGGGGKGNSPHSLKDRTIIQGTEEPTNLSCLLQPFSCSDSTAGKARSAVDFEIGSVCLPAAAVLL